jgi:signal transduction histidine kinase
VTAASHLGRRVWVAFFLTVAASVCAMALVAAGDALHLEEVQDEAAARQVLELSRQPTLLAAYLKEFDRQSGIRASLHQDEHKDVDDRVGLFAAAPTGRASLTWGPDGPEVIAVAQAGDEQAVVVDRLVGFPDVAKDLLLFAALALVAGAFLAARLSARTVTAVLGPVEALRRQAEAMGRGREPGRLAVDPHAPTEIVELAGTLDRLIASLQAEREQEAAFLREAAHELRTPLALLSAYVDALEETEPGSPAFERALSRLAQHTAEMSRLVGQLLALSAPAPPSAAGERAPLGAVVEEVVEEASLLWPDVAFRCRAEVDAHVPAEAVRQILWILLDNAVKYGASPVSVEAERLDGEVELAVEDAGPGFPPEVPRDPFRRFRRGARARATVPGAGLGLALAAEAAAAVGGELVLPEGTGSRVRVRLPAG